MNLVAVVPPTVCCAVVLFSVTVPVLLPGLNVPLFVQLPLIVMFLSAAFSVVPGPMVRFPLIVTLTPSVSVEVPPTSRLPLIVAAVEPVHVLVPVPLVLRLP